MILSGKKIVNKCITFVHKINTNWHCSQGNHRRTLTSIIEAVLGEYPVLQVYSSVIILLNSNPALSPTVIYKKYIQNPHTCTFIPTSFSIKDRVGHLLKNLLFLFCHIIWKSSYIPTAINELDALTNQRNDCLCRPEQHGHCSSIPLVGWRSYTSAE